MLHDVAVGRPKQRVDHSSAGAIHAFAAIRDRLRSALPAATARQLAKLVALPIAGHHAGLADGDAELDDRLIHAAHTLAATKSCAPAEWLTPGLESLDAPPPLRGHPEPTLALELLIRMVFSCLVDADRLDSRDFEDAVKPLELRAARLRGQYASIAILRERIDRAIDAKADEAGRDSLPPTAHRLHEYRQQVLAACRAAAEQAPGLFTLAVDTGGGKTLSSLSFALRHAERHGLRRVIVVIPFTSIIEQTAAVYRQALGDLGDDVLEHHSAMEEESAVDRDGSPDPLAVRRRLSMENWDAPIVVTTAVQFFESLYAASPSRCRKLHNVARSVVVLDEAQTLPPQLLDPTIWVINELAERYGTTVVVSTATQPALEKPFPALRNARAIVPATVPRPRPRVRVQVDADAALPWSELAGRLAAQEQVLCITHLRRDAQELTRALDGRLSDRGTIHLSATMCPQHRSLALARIRDHLVHGRRCRVVSTQLVEAGVDLDFPVVFRALAGIDSLVQAAGRANREGKLGEEGGLLVVYRAPTEPPAGLPRAAAAAAETIFRAAARLKAPLELFAPETARSYFRRYYQSVGPMDAGITALRRELKYRTVAERYRFIPGGPVPIWIPFDATAEERIEEVRALGPSRERLRALQRYTVTVYPRSLEALQHAGHLEALDAGETARFYALRRSSDAYDHDRFGLDLDRIGASDPSLWIV